MAKSFFVILIMLIFVSRSLIAQELERAKGSVEVIQDERITQLADQYRKMSLNNPEIDGYRVQIFFDSGSNSKSAAATVKSDFELSYPGIRAFLSYKEPYYRLRVGNFRTLIEAVGFQEKIAGDYPNSFPVKDKIVL